jgi:hypothetical protein
MNDIEIPQVGTFWHRPPASDTGDATDEVLYERVGQALSQWEETETEFADLFGMLMSAESLAAERVFGTINGVHSKATALDAAAAVAFRRWRVSEEDRTTYRLLIAHYKAAAERRNDIAHAVVQRWSHNSKDSGAFLMPPGHATKKWAPFWERSGQGLDSLGAAYRYTSGDLDGITSKFGLLEMWAVNFEIHFMNRYGLPNTNLKFDPGVDETSGDSASDGQTTK